jgi:hypothetical protein
MKTLSPVTWALVSCFGLTLGCNSPSGKDDKTDSNAETGEGEGDGDGDGSENETGETTDDGTVPGDGDGDDDTGGSSGAMCDPKAQDCPEGEKCTFYRDTANPGGANKCVLIMGSDQVGDPCMELEGDSDSCALGLHCWGTEPDGETGACVEFCDVNNQCSTGDPCTITNSGTLPMCLPVCDPLAPDCPGGWACYDDWEFSDYWFCDRDKSGSAGSHGDPCSTINGCNPGLICAISEVVDSETCATSGSGGCCAVVCDLTDPVDCPGPAEQCLSYYAGSPPPQYADVGMCAIPE